MNLDTRLIDAKLNPKNIEDFKNAVKEEIVVEQLTKFRKMFVSSFAYIFGIIIVVVGIILSFFIPRSNIANYSGYVTIFLGSSFLSRISGFRKKIIRDAIKNFDGIKVFGKGLSFFGVSQDKVFTYDSTQIQREKYEMFRELSCAPSDAQIYSFHGKYGFTHQGISTSFASIVWHGTTEVQTKKGTETEDHYESQFFVFEDNLDPKWKDFEFSLFKGLTLSREKDETLENDFFNKEFNYYYNDPLKLRLLFKLSTQERVLMKGKNDRIVVAKKGPFVTIAVKQDSISPWFRPFFLRDDSFSKIDELQDRLPQLLESDFQYLMNVVGHARLLDELYKKN